MAELRIIWSPEDIQSLRPNWTLEQCSEWLAENGSQIKDRLIELGWDVISILLDLAEGDLQ